MLTLFHDVTDPVSAVAVARCTRLARQGLAIDFEGVDTLAVDVALPPDLEVLARLEGLAEEAAVEGMVLRRPAVRPPTGLAHVLLAHAEATPQAHAVRLALYRAYWRDGADLADPAVLTDLAVAEGLAAQPVRAVLADRVALAARRRAMTAFRRDGVGGVPVLLASRTLVPGLLPEATLHELAATT